MQLNTLNRSFMVGDFLSGGFESLSGIADSFGTYYARKEAYGQQAATQVAIAHGLITASGGVIGAAVGAAAGAFVGLIVPGLGTIVGAGIGLVVGYLGAVAGNTFYDNSVNRRNGDDMWGHIKDNLW